MRAFVYLIVFFSFFDLFVQLPIMSPLAQSLGAAPFLIGLAVGMYSFSNTIGNMLSGFWTDKRGPFYVLITGLLATGATLFFYGAAQSTWLLLLVRFAHGLAAGLITPAAFTYLANHTASEKRGQGAAVSGAFVGIAAITGPAFSGILASRTSEVHVLTIVGAAMTILGMAALLMLRKQPASSPLPKQDSVSFSGLLGNARARKAFTGAFLLMFSQGVLAYMLPLKIESLGYDSQTSGLLLSTFGVAAIIIFLSPANRLFDRLQQEKIFFIGAAMMGTSLLLISQLTAAVFLYATMSIYGIGFAFLFPSINSLLMNSVTPESRGTAYGFFYAFFSLGVVAGSAVTGALSLSPLQGFMGTGLLLIVAGLLVLGQSTKKPSSL
nr:MFS transporter [Domibacillus robiginosus]